MKMNLKIKYMTKKLTKIKSIWICKMITQFKTVNLPLINKYQIQNKITKEKVHLYFKEATFKTH